MGVFHSNSDEFPLKPDMDTRNIKQGFMNLESTFPFGCKRQTDPMFFSFGDTACLWDTALGMAGYKKGPHMPRLSPFGCAFFLGGLPKRLPFSAWFAFKPEQVVGNVDPLFSFGDTAFLWGDRFPLDGRIQKSCPRAAFFQERWAAALQRGALGGGAHRAAAQRPGPRSQNSLERGGFVGVRMSP